MDGQPMVVYLFGRTVTGQVIVEFSDLRVMKPYLISGANGFQNVMMTKSTGCLKHLCWALLKPWKLVAELKQGNESFPDAFDHFMSAASEKTHVLTGQRAKEL
jgi:hypothetical protein